MPSPPSLSSFQNSSGLSAPPGKRQPIPTMAMGSLRARSAASSLACIFSTVWSARLTGESVPEVSESGGIVKVLPVDMLDLFCQQPGGRFIRKVIGVCWAGGLELVLCGRCRTIRRRVKTQFLGQEWRERGHSGVSPNQGGREGQTQAQLQAIAQLQR